MRLQVKRVTVRNLNCPDNQPVFTEQWASVVFDGKRKAYQSAGYHYATEAKKAGLFWIDLQKQKKHA